MHAPLPDLGWSPPGRGAQTGWAEGRRAPSATAPPPPRPAGPCDAAGRARSPLAAGHAPLPGAAQWPRSRLRRDLSRRAFLGPDEPRTPARRGRGDAGARTGVEGVGIRPAE